MNNMFESAYFNKPYKTRDGKKAIYGGTNEASLLHSLMFQLEDGDAFLALYNSNGTYVMSKNAHHLDIISEWHEEIDEEELDKFAEKELPYFPNETNLDKEYNKIIHDLRIAYKAGYRKAKEE